MNKSIFHKINLVVYLFAWSSSCEGLFFKFLFVTTSFRPSSLLITAWTNLMNWYGRKDIGNITKHLTTSLQSLYSLSNWKYSKKPYATPGQNINERTYNPIWKWHLLISRFLQNCNFLVYVSVLAEWQVVYALNSIHQHLMDHPLHFAASRGHLAM